MDGRFDAVGEKSIERKIDAGIYVCVCVGVCKHKCMRERIRKGYYSVLDTKSAHERQKGNQTVDAFVSDSKRLHKYNMGICIHTRAWEWNRCNR